MLDALFSGTPLSELPVEGPARYLLAVNADAAARARLPASFLRTADRILRVQP
jgi:hypothetical protein